MSKSRKKKLAKEIETRVIEYLGSVNKAHPLIQHAAFDRICAAYNVDGDVCVFLAEGTSDQPEERVDYDIARNWIRDPVGQIYPCVSLPDFVEFEPDDHATAKALARMLESNQVTIPLPPRGNDDDDWQNFLDQLIDLLKKSPATKAMIRAELQAQAAAEDYELLIEEQEAQAAAEDYELLIEEQESQDPLDDLDM